MVSLELLEVYIVISLLCLMRGAQAQTDLALNKPAFMSTGIWTHVVARRANSGDLERDCCSPHCIQTDSEDAPYWGVDLEEAYRIGSVYVAARSPSACNSAPCSERLGNLEIRVGFSGNQTDVSTNNLCANFSDVIWPGTDRTFTCDVPTCGRYVTVQRTGPPYNEPFNLCEVRAYAASDLPVTTKNLVSKDKQVGKYLAGYVKFTESVSSATGCLRLCLSNQGVCRSVNYYVTPDGQQTCQVNHKALVDVGGTLSDDVTSTYYGLKESTCG